jgi:outer membrane protein
MKTIITTFAAALATAAAPAFAQSAGSWMVKAGVNHIEPDVKSGDLSPPSLPGTKIDVKGAASLIVTASWMWTDRISIEGYLGAPYEHDIVGDGAIAGVGKIASVKQVSPTVFAQYRFFEPSSSWRPYVGIGPTYANFFGEKGTGTLTGLTNPGGSPTRVKVDSAWGASAQVGVSVMLNERWFIDGSVIKTWLKTTSHLSTGQSIEHRLDPLSTNVSLGYRF